MSSKELLIEFLKSANIEYKEDRNIYNKAQFIMFLNKVLYFNPKGEYLS